VVLGKTALKKQHLRNSRKKGDFVLGFNYWNPAELHETAWATLGHTPQILVHELEYAQFSIQRHCPVVSQQIPHID